MTISRVKRELRVDQRELNFEAKEKKKIE